MQKIALHFILVIMLSQIMACSICKPSTKTKNGVGVEGYVFEKKGNTMPMKGKGTSKGIIFPTKIWVYRPLLVDQLIHQNGSFCEGVRSNPIDSAVADQKGHYAIHLPAGKYSLLVQYEKGVFIPFFSGNNEVSVIAIQPNQWTKLDIIINTQASY